MKTWGILDLSIDLSKSIKEKFNISHSSQGVSKGFNLSIERFGSGIGTSVIEEIENAQIMLLDGLIKGFKGSS